MMGLPDSVAAALDAVTYSARALAYLQIDPELRLIGAGGNLKNYGLDAVRPGQPAAEQALFLEGVLPPPEAPYLLPSLELDGGRAADVHFYLDGQCVWVVLLDVTRERDQAQRIQQKAYEMTLLQEKEAMLNRRLEAANAALLAAQRELEATHEHLQSELAEAAKYVRSLLPAPMSQPFTVDWCFVPFAALGGDAFGYGWIDPEHFALYLLDVCGHGVGPSLMSTAVLHALKAASLRDVDFRDPSQVLAALNDRYQMEGTDDLFFTLWYGIYHPASRRLDYGCAGHPPAALVAAGHDMLLLKSKGPAIGLMPGAAYARESVVVPSNSRLYLFSDGAFEVQRPDGTMTQLADLLTFLGRRDIDLSTELDNLYQSLIQIRGEKALDDDFSIIRCMF
jgi:sigma-B regulation protein RsbU (phosphoserine phosphatase)